MVTLMMPFVGLGWEALQGAVSEGIALVGLWKEQARVAQVWASYSGS